MRLISNMSMVTLHNFIALAPFGTSWLESKLRHSIPSVKCKIVSSKCPQNQNKNSFDVLKQASNICLLFN